MQQKEKNEKSCIELKEKKKIRIKQQSFMVSLNEEEENEINNAIKKMKKKEENNKKSKLLLLRTINNKFIKNNRRKVNKLSKEEIEKIKEEENEYRIKFIEKSKLNNEKIKIDEEEEEEDNEEINNEISKIKQKNIELKNEIIQKKKTFEEKEIEFENELNNNENIKNTLNKKYKKELEMKLKELENSLNEKLQKSIEILLKEKKEEREIKNKRKDENEMEKKNEFSLFNSSNMIIRRDFDRKPNFIKDIPTNLIEENKTFKEKNKFENKYYSYTCDYVHNINLSAEIDEGIENTVIVLWLKNDGTLDWPENRTQLIFNRNKSDCSGNNIILRPQRVNEVEKYEVIFNGLGPLGEGTYKSYLNIKVDGVNIGEEVKLTVIIKKKVDPYEDIEKYRDIINKLRNEYNLNENDYSDKVLFDALKKNNYDIDATFLKIIE